MGENGCDRMHENFGELQTLKEKKERMINDKRIWHVTKMLKWIYTFSIKVKDQMGKEINKGEYYIYVGCHSRKAQPQKQY